jgi:hypothetical protein
MMRRWICNLVLAVALGLPAAGTSVAMDNRPISGVLTGVNEEASFVEIGTRRYQVPQDVFERHDLAPGDRVEIHFKGPGGEVSDITPDDEPS